MPSGPRPRTFFNQSNLGETAETWRLGRRGIGRRGEGDGARRGPDGARGDGGDPRLL